MRRLLLIGRFVLGVSALAWPLVGQSQKHELRLRCNDSLPEHWLRPVEMGALQQLGATLTTQLAFLQGQGYLEARVDGCETDSIARKTTCLLDAGRRYRWARLSGSGIPVEIASEARFRERAFNGQPIAPVLVQRLVEDLLRRSEDSGFPFASVLFDSLRQEAEGIRATVRLDLGRAVRFDSVVVRGNVRTSLRLLQSHVGVRPGDMYNESIVRSIERRLRELPFVQQKQRPYVQFTSDLTKLFLFLDGKKASSINGILGVQPDPVSGDVKLTGDLDLRLRNALQRGEAIELNWRSLADATQDLKVRGNLPYAFRTPFGIDGQLKLFKRDSTFLEVALRSGLDYLLLRGDKVGVFINSKTSERLGRNTIALPGLADVRIVSYGLTIARERFDYRYNPRRGHSVRLEGSAGRKRTTTAVLGEDGIAPTLRSTQYELEGIAVGHVPIRTRSTIRFVAQGGWMINENLYRNELYRFGGLKTLRGADEASLFASAYAVGTVEYRYVYEENANFFVFMDQGWWEDAAQATLVTDTPMGFGAGTTFETKAGLFSLTYALGRQFDNPILLRGGKVHFGFTSLF